MDAVHGQVEGCEAAGQEAAPPPVIILGAQVKVAQQDGRLRARDDEDQVDEEQEAVHVVDVRGPDRVQDEKELDENAAKGEDSAHDDAGDGLRVEALVRDLAGNLVGAHRLLDTWLPEIYYGLHRHDTQHFL